VKISKNNINFLYKIRNQYADERNKLFFSNEFCPNNNKYDKLEKQFDDLSRKHYWLKEIIKDIEKIGNEK
jgi:hypothetical protein